MKKLLGNESGVALIMVMTAILILMAMWGDFTFESKIARIKTTNMLDKTQSRLMAETAMELAMVRLKLYKEAYNTRITNQNVAGVVTPQLLNQLWEVPFVYPVPVGKNVGAAAKSAIDTFTKESFLEGEMKLSVQNISNKLNLNMIRLSVLKDQTQLQAGTQGGQQASAAGGAQGGLQATSGGGGGTVPGDLDGDGVADPDPAAAADPNFSMEQQLLKHLTRRLREKGEEDEAFRDRFGNVDPIQLIASLKFYISDKNPRRQNKTQIDMLMDNSEQMFNEAKITPKYGPLSSFSEIYIIPGWDDQIVELIRAEFDVFPVVMIDLNKLTANMLQMLIPNINENEIKEFFQWRDNPEKPQFFNSIDDFKNYITTTASILSTTNFEDLFGKYKAQGIEFGTSPTLFRILAEGTVNSTSTTLVATVSLPTTPRVVAPGGTQGTTTAATAGGTQGGTTAGTQGGTAGGTTTGGATAQTPQTLLDPRIIDIQVN